MGHDIIIHSLLSTAYFLLPTTYYLQHTKHLLEAVVIELEQGAFLGGHVSHLAFAVGPLGAVSEHYALVCEGIEEWPGLDKLLLV